MDFKPVPTNQQYDPEDAQLAIDSDQLALSPLGPSLYEYKNRPRRDTWATIIYCVFIAVSLIGSIASFSQTNKDAMKGLYSVQFLANSTTCDAKSFNSTQKEEDEDHGTFGSAFAMSTAVWLPVSVVAGLIFSIAYLYLFRNHAVKMVYASFIASVAISIVIAIISFASGAVAGGIILLIMAAMYAAITWWIRDQLKLVGQLLSVAGKGLTACPGIISSAIVIKVAGVAIMFFMFAGIVAGAFVGRVVPNPSRTLVQPTQGTDVGYCLQVVAGQTQYVDCCSYETKGWAMVHILFTCIALSWTAQVLLQLKLYVVADTLAQWYFEPPGHSDPNLVPSAVRAVRHGLTSSFGSVCFSGAILMIIEAIRKAMNNAQNNAEGAMKLVCCILNCFAQCLLELLEQFTRFATIATAITGEGFIPAARNMFQVLKRNFLATYSLWWIPDFVLGMSCFIISMAWACFVFFLTYLRWKDGSNAVGLAFAVSAVSLAALGFILYFLASIMLDGVNSIYICFSLDRDRKLVSHAEIHEVFLAVPSLQGAIIQEPDGGIAYGAPSQPTQAPYQQQPPPSYASLGMTPQYTGYAPQQGGYPGYAPAGPQGYPPPAYPAHAPMPYGAPYSQQVSPGYPAPSYPSDGRS